jgi:uncharacterized protein
MNKILLLGLSTILVFGLGGVLIIEYAHDANFIDILGRGWDIRWQITVGVLYGLISAGICLLIINSNFFKKERDYYAKMVSKFDLNYPSIIFVSLCAGIGEEIFFRAAIQPMIGIWLTALIFVFIHGYLNPRNWRISVYGTVMVVIMAGIGYLYEYTGIFTIMTAHTVIDIILFTRLMKIREGR